MQNFGAFQSQEQLLSAAKQLSQKMSECIMSTMMTMAKAQEQLAKDLSQAQNEMMDAVYQFCTQTGGPENKTSTFFNNPADVVRNFYETAFRQWVSAVPQWMNSSVSNPMEKAWKEYYANKMDPTKSS